MAIASTLILVFGEVRVPDPLLGAAVAALLSGGLISAVAAFRKTNMEVKFSAVQELELLARELRADLDRANVKAAALENRIEELRVERDTWRARALAAET